MILCGKDFVLNQPLFANTPSKNGSESIRPVTSAWDVFIWLQSLSFSNLLQSAKQFPHQTTDLFNEGSYLDIPT